MFADCLGKDTCTIGIIIGTDVQDEGGFAFSHLVCCALPCPVAFQWYLQGHRVDSYHKVMLVVVICTTQVTTPCSGGVCESLWIAGGVLKSLAVKIECLWFLSGVCDFDRVVLWPPLVMASHDHATAKIPASASRFLHLSRVI
jgi:hypothetical protein